MQKHNKTMHKCYEKYIKNLIYGRSLFKIFQKNKNLIYAQPYIYIANVFFYGTKACRIRLRTVPHHYFDITGAVRAVGVPGSL